MASFGMPRAAATSVSSSRHTITPAWPLDKQAEQIFFHGEDPFLYHPPKIFEQNSSITIKTPAERTRIENLESAGHAVYDRLWSAFLGLLLAHFWKGLMPIDDDIYIMVLKCFSQMEDDAYFLDDFILVAHNWSAEPPSDRLLQPFGPENNKIRVFFLDLIKREASRFISCCVMRARWVSRSIFNDMEVHSLHLPAPDRHSARLNLRDHAFCAPVARKEILDRQEGSKQIWHLYDPDVEDPPGKIKFHRYCSPYIVKVPKAFYSNFSEPQFWDSPIANALRQIPLPDDIGHFPLLSIAIPCILLRGENYFQLNGWHGPITDSKAADGLVEHVIKMKGRDATKNVHERDLLANLVSHLIELNELSQRDPEASLLIMKITREALTQLWDALAYPVVNPIDNGYETSSTLDLGHRQVKGSKVAKEQELEGGRSMPLHDY